MKYMGAYVKIPQWGYMEHGLKDIAFYVQKHSTSSSLLYLTAGSRQAARGTRICETCLLHEVHNISWWNVITHPCPNFHGSLTIPITPLLHQNKGMDV